MVAPARSITQAVIAHQGLDVLQATRLKVACALLMADYIQAELQPWPSRQVDVLVVNGADAQGRLAGQQAHAQQLPMLAFGDDAADATASAWLPRSASVRQIHRALQAVLDPAGTTGPSRQASGFFAQAATAAGQACVLDNGLLQVTVDAGRQRLTLLRDLPYADYLQAAAGPGWNITVQRPPASVGDSFGQHAFEDFCWQAATLTAAPLRPIDAAAHYRLRAWPDVQAGQLPSAWLPAISALLLRAWTPAELARACGLALDEVLRLLAAAQLSGILADAVVAASGQGRGKVVMTAFFSRIARRFGVYFAGKERD